MLKFSGKIPVSIYPFFWVLAAIIGWLNTFDVVETVVWVAVILVSILVHEYGHALTAVACGQKAQIDLVGFGGVTRRIGTTKLWQEFVIILNGPLAGFILCGAVWCLLRIFALFAYPHSMLLYSLQVAFYVNFVWTILNLVPVQPLDGGKLFAVFMELCFGLKGVKVALFISTALAAVIGLAFFAFQAFLIGSLFFIFTYESYRSWKNSLSVTPQDQNVLLQHLLKAAEKDMQKGNAEDAIVKLQQVREFAKSGLIHVMATEQLAHLEAEKRHFDVAYSLLLSIKKQLSAESTCLLHQLAYQQGAWAEAISIGDRVYQLQPRPETALMNAFSHALLGQVRPAIGWLQCISQEGNYNVKEVLDRKEFDSIRQDPLFQQFIHKQFQELGI